MKLLKTRPDWHYLVLVSALLFVIEIINVLSGRWLNQFSIVPRDIATLPYIMTAPWLHISIAHFWSNCLTFVILSFLLLEFGLKRYALVSLLLMLSTGLVVWIFWSRWSASWCKWCCVWVFWLLSTGGMAQ